MAKSQTCCFLAAKTNYDSTGCLRETTEDSLGRLPPASRTLCFAGVASSEDVDAVAGHSVGYISGMPLLLSTITDEKDLQAHVKPRTCQRTAAMDPMDCLATAPIPLGEGLENALCSAHAWTRSKHVIIVVHPSRLPRAAEPP